MSDVRTASHPIEHGEALVRTRALAHTVHRPAHLWRTVKTRATYELRSYSRSKDQMIFTFFFPLLMLAVFASALGDERIGTAADGTGGTTMAAYYLAAMAASGVFLSGVQNLSIDIAIERTNGSLKQLSGTPLSPVAYFLGKFAQVLATSVLQQGALIALGALVFHVELSSDPAIWLRYTWIFLLSLVACSILGIALSTLPRSTRSATGVVIPIVLLLQFISGVYLQFSLLPDWMQQLSSAFPLRWLAQGMRSVFLPDTFAAAEAGEAWQLGLIALMLVSWALLGAVLCRLLFRWHPRNS